MLDASGITSLWCRKMWTFRLRLKRTVGQCGHFVLRLEGADASGGDIGGIAPAGGAEFVGWDACPCLLVGLVDVFVSGGCSRESSGAISCGGDVGLSVVASISVSSSIDAVAGLCGGEDGDGGVAGISSCEDVIAEVFLRVDMDVVAVVVVLVVAVSSTDVLAVEACFGEEAAVVVVA